MFKFVLTHSGRFYIIDKLGYHQDTDQTYMSVRAAGYFSINDDKDPVQITLSGRSIGYNISFTERDQDFINTRLSELNITVEKILHHVIRKSYGNTNNYIDLIGDL